MRRLLTVTFLSGVVTLIRMGCGFIIAKTLAVYAGPAGMALLGQVQSLIAGFVGVVNAPVGNGVVRYTAAYRHAGVTACTPWWRASLWWLAWVLCIVLPIGLLGARPIAQSLLHDAHYAWIIWLTTAVLPVAAMGTLIHSVFNGHQQYRCYFTLSALSTILSCLLIVILTGRYGINGALLGACLQAGGTGCVLFLAARRQPWFSLCNFWGRSAPEYKAKMGGYVAMALCSALTVPMTAISVRNSIVQHVGWAAAGQWQAVWKISEVYIGVITLAIGTYCLPRLATLSGSRAIRREIHRIAGFFLPLAALSAVTIYLARDLLISTLFTAAFKPAAELFAIQLVGDVIKVAGWLYAYPMLSCGATLWFIGTEMLFAITFIVLSWALVPHFLAQGVNMAYCLSYLLYFIFAFFMLGFFAK